MTFSESLQNSLVEGKLEDALSLLQSRVKENPTDHEAQLELIRVTLGLKRFDEVEKLLQPLLKQKTLMGDVLEIRGLSYQMQGKLKEAKADFNKALGYSQKTTSLFYNLGYILTHQDDFTEEVAILAEKYLKEVLKLDKNHFQAQFELAALYTRVNRLPDAILACQATIELNPLHVRSYLFLGELFTRAGEIDKVIDLYKAGLSLNPRVHVFRDEIIRLYKLQGSIEKALNVAIEQTAYRGAYEDYLELGNLAVQLGQVRVAEIAFLKAEETKPEDWKAPYNLAELYRGTVASHEEAEKAYQRSLKNAENAQSYTGLGLLALENEEKSDPKIALEHFRRALDIEFENPTHIFNLALVLNILEETDELTKLLNDAKKVIPHEQKILLKIEQMLN